MKNGQAESFFAGFLSSASQHKQTNNNKKKKQKHPAHINTHNNKKRRVNSKTRLRCDRLRNYVENGKDQKKKNTHTSLRPEKTREEKQINKKSMYQS